MPREFSLFRVYFSRGLRGGYAEPLASSPSPGGRLYSQSSFPKLLYLLPPRDNFGVSAAIVVIIFMIFGGWWGGGVVQTGGVNGRRWEAKPFSTLASIKIILRVGACCPAPERVSAVPRLTIAEPVLGSNSELGLEGGGGEKLQSFLG